MCVLKLRMLKPGAFRFLPLLALPFSLACTDSGDSVDSDEDQITSLTARQRTLTFDASVLVREGASGFEIESAITKQNQSAFGALRTANVGVNRRELKIPLAELDPAYLKKTVVNVVDPSRPGATPTRMLKVSYRYTDSALVPKSMARRSVLVSGVLAGNYQSQSARILKECTGNDSEAREFQNSIWYVFNPSLDQCETAMATEQKAIDRDRAKIADADTISISEANRLYKTVTMSFGFTPENDRKTYPEYDQLYAGGVKPGRVVIGMVNGLMADWAAGEKHDTIDDYGWPMWFEGLEEIFSARPGFKFVSIEPSEDLTSLTLSTGKKVTLPNGFFDVMTAVLDRRYPAGLTYSDQRPFLNAAASKLLKHWVKFEATTTVKIGSATAKPFTFELDSYFGAETDPTPHKRAIKTSDIFTYNGHSYIGYGPLDPRNFRSSDFPSTYQILNLNGCVSYNYYERDYIPLKAGGTKKLDLVTNGLESWVSGSGGAVGRYVGSLIDGKLNDYKSVLAAAQFLPNEYGYEWGQDALRVVDGELDNTYTPSKMPIRFQ